MWKVDGLSVCCKLHHDSDVEMLPNFCVQYIYIYVCVFFCDVSVSSTWGTLRLDYFEVHQPLVATWTKEGLFKAPSEDSSGQSTFRLMKFLTKKELAGLADGFGASFWGHPKYPPVILWRTPQMQVQHVWYQTALFFFTPSQIIPRVEQRWVPPLNLRVMSTCHSIGH